jgi:hypothetical protein
MKNNYTKIGLILLTYFITGCYTAKNTTTEVVCPTIYERDFTKIVDEKFNTNYNGETVSYNEIRFLCVNSALYTQKIMYDNFGRWDKVSNANKIEDQLLIWDDVDLFGDGQKFKVIAGGVEAYKMIYASVMVFDENEADLLASDSSEREKIIKYFSKAIRKLNVKNDDFYTDYYQTFDPLRLKVIELFKND